MRVVEVADRTRRVGREGNAADTVNGNRSATEVEGAAGARRAAGGIGERIAQTLVDRSNVRAPHDSQLGRDLCFRGREDLNLGEAQVRTRHRDADNLSISVNIGNTKVHGAVGVVGAALEDHVAIDIEDLDGKVGQPLAAAVHTVPEPDRLDVVGVLEVNFPPGVVTVGVGRRSGSPLAIGVAVDRATGSPAPTLGGLGGDTVRSNVERGEASG